MEGRDKTNIPNTVRIGSADYEVELTDEVLVMNSQQLKGVIDYEFHEIKISNTVQDRQGQEQTFLHELVHGIIDERSLNLAESDDETIVDEIAKGLHQVIRDNPEIFKTNSTKLTAEIRVIDTDKLKNIIQQLECKLDTIDTKMNLLKL